MGDENNTLTEKIELLRRVGIFSRLRDNEIEVIARYSEMRPFPAGTEIFEEGSIGEDLYVVGAGTVLITRREGDHDRDLARFIAGECFGELDMFQNSPRNARALAESDARLLVFPQRGVRFAEVLATHPEISAQLLHKLLAMIAGRIRSTNRLISEKSQWIQDLKKQMMSDKLTGLYNRTFLEEDFPSYLSEDAVLCLAVIKPDNFKLINDNYGHDTGDRVLRLLADTVKSALRENDIAVRYRGDEFAIVLNGTSSEDALHIAKRLKDTIRSLDVSELLNGQDLTITASVGIAGYPHHAEDAGSLVKIAFDTMLKAREGGGDMVLSA